MPAHTPTPHLPPWATKPPLTGKARSAANLQRGGIDERQQCEATTRTGRACRGPAKRGQRTCRRHWRADVDPLDEIIAGLCRP